MMQNARFPLEHMRLTQGRWSAYSHANKNAYDYDHNARRSPVRAPYDCVVRFVDIGWGAVIIESTGGVKASNGLVSKQWLMAMHNNTNTAGLVAGKTFKQGQIYTYMGDADLWGNTTGVHVHLEGGFGNAPQNWGQLDTFPHANIEDLFFINSRVFVSSSGGYRWKNEPPSAPAPSPDPFTKGKGIRLHKAKMYKSSSAQQETGTISGLIYLWDGKQRDGKYRVVLNKVDVGQSSIPSRWVNVEALTSKRSISPGTAFIIDRNIDLFSTRVINSSKGSIRGKVYVHDGIIANGRVRVTKNKANIRKIHQYADGWVRIAALQKYGV